MRRESTWILLIVMWGFIMGEGTCLTALAQTSDPILRLEVGTHNAGIYCIASDPSNRILVTGSEDKTVRVWDISGGGELLRTLRPPVGKGEEGHIFAVALSPDARSVACGGRTGSPKQGDACVYLFDRTTGTLTRRIGGLSGWVQHLAYTRDGHFLAVVTGEGGGRPGWSGLKIYRLPEYVLVGEDLDYGDFVKWVESDATGVRVATACYDGFIRLYDLSRLKGQEGSSPRPLMPVSRIRAPGGRRPWGLAFSPDGACLAVGYERSPRVDVLQVKGNALEHAFSPDATGLKGGLFCDLRTVAWSRDGRFLYGGGGFRRKGMLQIRKWSEGGRGRYQDLPVEPDLPLFHMLSLGDGGVAFASRDGSFGVLNDREESVLQGPRSIPIYRHLHEGFRLSPNGAGIQFAFEASGKSPAIFLADERILADASSISSAAMGLTSWKGPITEGLDVSDWKGSPVPKLKGKPLPVDKNDVAISLAIKPDRTGFLLGTGSHLYCFDSAGRVLWRMRMPGVVWGVNTNGQLAVAALGDGTIRWYRVSDGREMVAFFPHPDRTRWLLWTPGGYYDASPGGEDFIGWHVNNGREHAADFYPASRFRSTFHRPDVIDAVFKTLDESDALRLASEGPGGRQRVETSLLEKLPPVSAIVSPGDGSEMSATSVKIRYSIRSREPLTGVKFLVDGRPAQGEGLAQLVRESGEVSVTIPARDCRVSVLAENRNGAGEPATIRLLWKGGDGREDPFHIQPDLYVLAVGVSQYEDPALRLDLAAKDAVDFGEVWKSQRGTIYGRTEVRLLTDAQATKGNILDGLEWLQRQVTHKDVAILFLAGHGVTDSMGMFYFLPVDVDPEKLKRTGISQSDVASTVASIAGKVVVFMDACHSGNLMEKVKRRALLDVTSVINELASAENGAVVFSSATGRQYALENVEWGNGAFTRGIVEGIQGKADFRGTGRITVNMLDLYVSERVKELTRGRQTPSTVKPPNVPDFPLAMRAK